MFKTHQYTQYSNPNPQTFREGFPSQEACWEWADLRMCESSGSKKKKIVIFTEGDVVDRYTVYYELGHGK